MHGCARVEDHVGLEPDDALAIDLANSREHVLLEGLELLRVVERRIASTKARWRHKPHVSDGRSLPTPIDGPRAESKNRGVPGIAGCNRAFSGAWRPTGIITASMRRPIPQSQPSLLEALFVTLDFL